MSICVDLKESSYYPEIMDFSLSNKSNFILLPSKAQQKHTQKTIYL